MPRSTLISTLFTLFFTLSVASCGQYEETADGAELSIYEQAVASNSRPEGDRVRDADRKPAKVLEFLGIAPGMTVLDLFAGSGYYSEIIAGVVGENGTVIAQSNQAYLGFVGTALNDRFGDGQFSNVEILMVENNELRLQAESLDAVMLVLSFHDLYHADPENGWVQIDREKFLAELSKGLKPGGTVGIIDHFAEIGAPATTGESVHRIDPAIVIAVMTAAGFELVAQSDLLRNAKDDPSKIVFAPDLRGKTDRFILCFRKP